MALKSCKYCGKVVDKHHQCKNKPKPRYTRTESEQGRYTATWNNKSYEIKERSMFLCAVCKDKGIYTYDNLETHHIIPLRDRPVLLLDDNNLICLCEACHEAAERGTIDVDYMRVLVKARDKSLNVHPPTPLMAKNL